MVNVKTQSPRAVHIKYIRLALGYGFLLLGMVGGLIPIFQGWIFVGLGLILLKDHARWARWISVRLRRRYPKARPAFKKAYQKIDEILEKSGLA